MIEDKKIMYYGLMTDSDIGSITYGTQFEFPNKQSFSDAIGPEWVILKDIEEFFGYWCYDTECELIDPDKFDDHFHVGTEETLNSWKGWKYEG